MMKTGRWMILRLTRTYAGIHILLMETLLIVSGIGKRV